MKRIEPVRENREKGYPTVEEAGVNRRGFMRVIVASGAAAAGSVVLGEDRAFARGVARRPSFRVAFNLKPPVSYKGCQSSIVQVLARTRDSRYHAFLQRKGEQAGIMATIRRTLLSGQCSDLKGSARYKLGRAVATALQKRYRKRTGNTGGYGSVYLTVMAKK